MPVRVFYGTDSESSAKANEHAITALKQLVTLSSGSLVLTITFLKNIVGTLNSESPLYWMIPCAWFCLIVSVWFGWVSIAEGAKQINLKSNNVYVFARGRLRSLARIAQWSFFLGLISIAIFSSLNFKRPKLEEPTKNCNPCCYRNL